MNKSDIVTAAATEIGFPVIDLEMASVEPGDATGLPVAERKLLGDLGKDREGRQWQLWYVPASKEFAFSKDGVIEKETYKEVYLMDKVDKEKIDCLAEEMSWMTKRYN